MEMVKVALDAARYDQAVHGKADGPPTLPEAGDLAIYVKKHCTHTKMAGAVVTFTVQLPGGQLRPVQACTTVSNLINALSVLKGWREGGHLEEPQDEEKKLLQHMTEPELSAHLSHQLRFITGCHTADTLGSMLIIFQKDKITQYGATIDPETAPQALRELADRIEKRQTVKR